MSTSELDDCSSRQVFYFLTRPHSAKHKICCFFEWFVFYSSKNVLIECFTLFEARFEWISGRNTWHSNRGIQIVAFTSRHSWFQVPAYQFQPPLSRPSFSCFPNTFPYNLQFSGPFLRRPSHPRSGATRGPTFCARWLSCLFFHTFNVFQYFSLFLFFILFMFLFILFMFFQVWPQGHLEGPRRTSKDFEGADLGRSKGTSKDFEGGTSRWGGGLRPSNFQKILRFHRFPAGIQNR